MSLTQRITSALTRTPTCEMVGCDEPVAQGEDYCGDCKRLCQQVGRRVASMRRTRGDGR